MSRGRILRSMSHLVLTVAACAFASSADATTVWNESVNGDLSNNQNAPTAISTSVAVNSVIGNVNGGAGDSQDWITFNVPSGNNLTSVVLSSYTSSDTQGFTGVGSGTTFPGNAFAAGSYLGYAHFGTTASNGSDLPSNVVGLNILPAMGLNGAGHTGAGSIGFTPPLPAGDYTFLIQQLGSSTGYQFDYTIAAAPEPASVGMLAGACVLVMRRRRSV